MSDDPVKKAGNGRWGDDIWRGTNVDGPVSHSVGSWAARLGVDRRAIELALISVFKARRPLDPPVEGLPFAHIALLRTREGCEALYRLVALELEAAAALAARAKIEAKVQR